MHDSNHVYNSTLHQSPKAEALLTEKSMSDLNGGLPVKSVSKKYIYIFNPI